MGLRARGLLQGKLVSDATISYKKWDRLMQKVSAATLLSQHTQFLT